jgi:4-hydroxythreonine-4-phosphate dehydrogenase
MNIPRIVITSGEPAGIGPDIVATIAQYNWPVELIVIADPELLKARAKNLQLPLELLPFNSDELAKPTMAGQIKIIPCYLRAPCIAGQLTTVNAGYVQQMLSLATSLALQKTSAALVTAPVHKGIMNDAGIVFSGHTDFFAQAAGHNYATLMLFTTPFTQQVLRVALTTVHIPLAQVATTITKTRLQHSVTLLHSSLQRYFNIHQAKIAVCGLNPHAGESGYLGQEELEIIIPSLDELRLTGLQLIGPLAADTIFTPKILSKVDAILAMYHDQALPVIKTISFGQAVNVSLGLPFIRTSVDHGTALDIAGSKNADASSLQHAITLAHSMILANQRHRGTN